VVVGALGAVGATPGLAVVPVDDGVDEAADGDGTALGVGDPGDAVAGAVTFASAPLDGAVWLVPGDFTVVVAAGPATGEALGGSKPRASVLLARDSKLLTPTTTGLRRGSRILETADGSTWGPLGTRPGSAGPTSAPPDVAAGAVED
jgi:hypothetical protein